MCRWWRQCICASIQGEHWIKIIVKLIMNVTLDLNQLMSDPSFVQLPPSQKPLSAAWPQVVTVFGNTPLIVWQAHKWFGITIAQLARIRLQPLLLERFPFQNIQQPFRSRHWGDSPLPDSFQAETSYDCVANGYVWACLTREQNARRSFPHSSVGWSTPPIQPAQSIIQQPLPADMSSSGAFEPALVANCSTIINIAVVEQPAALPSTSAVPVPPLRASTSPVPASLATWAISVSFHCLDIWILIQS